jgi:RimJ/RimL family protein N-acetyltransferase
LTNADYFGKGYATEAFNAFLSEFFNHMPVKREDGCGLDFVEGWTDIQNWQSRRVLEKSGFTYCETVPDPDNALRGPSEISIYRKTRPGKTLKDLGLLPPARAEDRSAAPTPPVQ